MFRRSTHIFRLTVTAFMAVWLSGFIFLIICGRGPDAVESCPLARAGIHCDKAEKQRNAEKVEKQTGDQGVDCCAFIPAFFDKTRTLDSQQIAPPVLSSPVSKPIPVIVRANFIPAFQPNSFVPPRNNTFLINRSFRL
jgi:hypothetical protein